MIVAEIERHTEIEEMILKVVKSGSKFDFVIYEMKMIIVPTSQS